MYLTDFRENTLKDVITKLEPGLFKAVTGLSVADFHLLVSLNVFNNTHMDQAVFAFRRYEDSSLSYTGIDSHEGLSHAEAFQSILIRLGRAARALDHMLAALSNPLNIRRDDVIETAAEAFDRNLFISQWHSTSKDASMSGILILRRSRRKIRNQSLDSRDFVKKKVKKKVKKQYNEPLLGDVVRLQKYAWVCKHLRNHIHDGILDVVPQPGRHYGNATTAALMLGSIPDFAPEAGNLDQDHYDDLGVWLAC